MTEEKEQMIKQAFNKAFNKNFGEEIIIDGVNVAGCQCFENDKCLWCKKYYENNATPNCKEVKNCYYKQLKRLEQENKELKAYKDINEDFKKAWDELNKKYTEVLKLAKENADSNEYCLQELEQENEIIAKQYNSLLKQYNSLMAYTKELEAKLNEQQSSNIR